MLRRYHCINAISEVRSDRRGATALILGLSMAGLMGLLALGVDVSSAVSAHARLRQAADVAALAAVREAAVLTANDSNAPLQGAQAAGVQRFNAQANSIPKVAVPQVTVNVVRQNLTITATVTFQASYATQIANALSGISPSYGPLASIPLGGSVAAQQTVGAYVDIQVLMDTSNSMAITATPNDAKLFQYATAYIAMWFSPSQLDPYGWRGNGAGCTVACHASWDYSPTWRVAPVPGVGGMGLGGTQGGYYAKPPLRNTVSDPYLQYFGAGFQPNLSNWPDANDTTYNPATYDFYALAKYLNVTLRIDLLKKSASSIAQAIATAPDGDKFRFGYYTFDTQAYQQYPLGAAANAGGAISSTEVSRIPYPSNPGSDTSVAGSISQFTNWVAPAGDGSSQQHAQKFAVIFTDGVEDFQSNGRQTPVFDHTACNTLKAPVSQGGKGAGVFVLHAASLDNFIQDGGGDPTAKFNATVKALQDCATDPTYYFLASSPADIQAATQKIINLALSRPTVLTMATQPPHNNNTASFVPTPDN